MSLRLGPKQRLKKSGQFQQAVKKGRFLKGRLLNFWTLPNPEGGPACLGMIVSKRVDKRAVGRNLWKRRVREIFRKRQQEWAPGCILVVQARALKQIPETRALEEDFVRLCTQAGVYKGTESKET